MNLREPGKGWILIPSVNTDGLHGWMEEEVVETYRKHGRVLKQTHTCTHTHSLRVHRFAYMNYEQTGKMGTYKLNACNHKLKEQKP